MRRGLKYLFVLGLSSTLSLPVMALELFGVSLEATNRDELRKAAREAGLVLIREGGDDKWFDLYDSSGILTGSKRFFLGFVKKGRRFAFAEYEFRGLNSQQMLRNLTIKYGPAETRIGRYVSDRSYHWQRDGIDIELSSDWQNYKTRLIYIHPLNLVDLRTEQSAYNTQQETEAEQVSLY